MRLVRERDRLRKQARRAVVTAEESAYQRQRSRELYRLRSQRSNGHPSLPTPLSRHRQPVGTSMGGQCLRWPISVVASAAELPLSSDDIDHVIEVFRDHAHEEASRIFGSSTYIPLTMDPGTVALNLAELLSTLYILDSYTKTLLKSMKFKAYEGKRQGSGNCIRERYRTKLPLVGFVGCGNRNRQGSGTGHTTAPGNRL
ncbi:hypothetical protein ACHQM5_023793 [Ranunculus cassubicifolius]